MIAILMTLVILDPNPMLGPNNDWAPLMQEYSVCQQTSFTYFDYTVCTMSAYDKAVHPTWDA
jgi:hypothetical protein